MGDLKKIFGKPSDPKLAAKISIRTPKEFMKSIKVLNKDGLTSKEKKALVLARTRAKLQLRRRNLSSKERGEFREISKMKIPKISKR